MRLFQRHLAKVTCNGRFLYGCLRPMAGQWQVDERGAVVQDMRRLLLPRNALIRPGDFLETEDGKYVCTAVRILPGHVQADIRRCNR